jgi:hypothetical protein
VTVEQLAFPLPVPDQGPAGGPVESAGQRLTRRQHELAARGGHPLSLALSRPLQVHPDAAAQDRRCGNCTFRESITGPDHGRSRPRCVIEKGPSASTFTNSPFPRLSWGDGTQIRAWWPACVDHEWGDRISPDAARSGPVATGP